jgi:hypothetical protein
LSLDNHRPSEDTHVAQSKLPKLSREEWVAIFAEQTDGAVASRFGTSRQAVWTVRNGLEIPPKSIPTRARSASGYIPWSNVSYQEYEHPLLMKLRDAWRLDHGGTVERPVALAEWLEFMADASLPNGLHIGRAVVVFDSSQPLGSDRFFIEPWRDGDLKYARPH